MRADGTFLEFLSGRRSDLYLPPKRFLGKRVDAVLPPKVGRQCQQAIRKALKTRAGVRFTINLSIGGLDQHFDVRMFPLDHNRVLSIVQSDTERHQMEEALRIQKDLGTRLAEAGNMKTALAQVLKAMMQIPGMDACGIYLMDSQTGDFCLAAHQGISARMAKAMAHIEPNTRVAACILDGHTMYDRFQNLDPHRITSHQMKGWRATGVIPVLNEGQVIASLHFCSRTQDEFPPTARSLFKAIANQIGGVLTRLEAQDLLQKAHDELDHQVRERTSSLQKALETLRESESQTRALLLAMPDVMVKIQSDTTCIAQHTPHQPDIYLDIDQFIGKKLSKVLPTNVVKLYRRYMRLTLKTRKMQVFEYEMPIRGHLRQREARMVAHNHDYFLIIVRDITERKKMEQEILGIEEREKQRLGRDLHDSLCQQLMGIAMLSSHLKQKIHFEPKDVLEKLAAEIESLLAEAGSQAHALARGLLPVPDEPTGLLSALRELADNISKLFRVQCQFQYDRAICLKSGSIATHLYRIAQEAISNAIRHGHAGHIQLSLFCHQNVLHFSIQDNGRGMSSEIKRHKGMGLSVMEYRARAIGGTFEIHAAPGRGTIVSCALPLSGKKI